MGKFLTMACTEPSPKPGGLGTIETPTLVLASDDDLVRFDHALRGARTGAARDRAGRFTGSTRRTSRRSGGRDRRILDRAVPPVTAMPNQQRPRARKPVQPDHQLQQSGKREPAPPAPPSIALVLAPESGEAWRGTIVVSESSPCSAWAQELPGYQGAQGHVHCGWSRHEVVAGDRREHTARSSVITLRSSCAASVNLAEFVEAEDVRDRDVADSPQRDADGDLDHRVNNVGGGDRLDPG